MRILVILGDTKKWFSVSVRLNRAHNYVLAFRKKDLKGFNQKENKLLIILMVLRSSFESQLMTFDRNLINVAIFIDDHCVMHQLIELDEVFDINYIPTQRKTFDKNYYWILVFLNISTVCVSQSNVLIDAKRVM